MSDYKFTGTVVVVMPTEQKSENFKTRNFVLSDNDPKYPQTIQFQAVNERCDALQTIHPGDTVTVSFDLRGREWNGKYLTNLNAWRIEKHGVTQSALPPASGFADPVKAPSIDDLPF